MKELPITLDMRKNPSVGISYSWKDNDINHKSKVKLFAEKLLGNGIGVQVDFYDYEPTHDLYYFMERLIHETDYILFVCESSSKTKADEYKGQLGSQEVPHLRPFLSDPKQEKIIPIIFEKDIQGNPIKPRFLKLPYGFDLSGDDTFTSETFYYLIDFLKGKRNLKPSITNLQDFSNKNHQGLPLIHNIKHRRINSFLTERTTNVIKQLSDFSDANKYKDFSEIKPLALISTSGEGKSTAIIEFCFIYGKQFDYLFWIDCNSNIKSQLVEIGSENYLKLYDLKYDLLEEEKDARIKKVVTFFNDNNCLIIFDDLNLHNEIVDFLPKNGRSRILLTSTNFTLKLSQEVEVIDFPNLGKDDALNVLLTRSYQQRISESDKEKYFELCDFLNYMPFALEIANEYIEEYFEMGIDFFINELKESSVKWEGLLNSDKRGKINQAASVVALIEKKTTSVIEIKKIKELLSFIGASNIAKYELTYSIFEELTSIDKKEFIAIKKELSSKGIVDLGDDKFIIHKLFTEYFSLFISENEQKIILGENLSKKCNETKNMMFQLGCWINYEKERNGLQNLCDNIKASGEGFNTDKLISLYSCLWSHYNLEDNNPEALESINNALLIADNDTKVATDYFAQRKFSLLFQKAITIHKIGNYPEAEKLYIEVLKNENFVARHIIINSLFYCGHIARYHKVYENAIIWYEDALNIILNTQKEAKDEDTKNEASLFLLRAYNYLKSIFDEISDLEMIRKCEKEIENLKPSAKELFVGVQIYMDYIYSGTIKPSSNIGLQILLVDKDGNFKYF